MRLLVLAAFLAAPLAAAPLAAQTHLDADPGPYVRLDQLSTRSALDSDAFNTNVIVGYRWADGFDLGVRVRYGARSIEPGEISPTSRLDFDSRYVAAGPVAGYTLPLGAAGGVRFEAEALLGHLGSEAQEVPEDDVPIVLEQQSAMWFELGGSGALFRRVPLGGRITLQPSIGAFAWVSNLGQQPSDALLYGVGYGTPITSEAGITVGLPLSLRLWETRTLTLAPSLDVGRRYLEGYASRAFFEPGFSLRFNF